ncbi:hypothetical protein PG984_013680 [Apiospora sp. TS-2023a]
MTMQETPSCNQGSSSRSMADRPRSKSADAVLTQGTDTLNDFKSYYEPNAAYSAGPASEDTDREASGSCSLDSDVDVDESELKAAISTFQGAVKDLKFTLGKTALYFRTKNEIRALCETSRPVQTLLFQYVHGTPEIPDSSDESPQLSDEDEKALTEAVQTLADCIVVILELVGDLLKMRTPAEANGHYAAYGECIMFGSSGGHGGDYGQWFANRSKAAYDLSYQIGNAQQVIRDKTQRLSEILAKYGIKDSTQSDSSCVATPAVPSTREESLPEGNEPRPGIIARCIKRITTAARNRFLPAEPQEDSTSSLSSTSDTDQSRAPRDEKRRYRDLKRQYSASKTFRDQKKQLKYHKEAEQDFSDLQAKLGEAHRNDPSAATETGQLLLNRKIETRIILHRRMQPQKRANVL